MKIQEILTLIQAVDEHGLTELQLDDDNTTLTLKKETPAAPVSVTSAPGGTELGNAGATAWTVGTAGAATGTVGAAAGTAGAAAGTAGNAGAAAAVDTAGIDSGRIISSPLVGIFYNAAAPDDEPFVKAGDTVKKGQVLGIIEAMKLMNEIECEYDGVVEAVLAGNEDVVEYGQPLFRIR